MFRLTMATALLAVCCTSAFCPAGPNLSHRAAGKSCFYASTNAAQGCAAIPFEKKKVSAPVSKSPC